MSKQHGQTPVPLATPIAVVKYPTYSGTSGRYDSTKTDLNVPKATPTAAYHPPGGVH